LKFYFVNNDGTLINPLEKLHARFHYAFLRALVNETDDRLFDLYIFLAYLSIYLYICFFLIRKRSEFLSISTKVV